MYKCRLTKNKFHTNKKKLINENETNQKKKTKIYNKYNNCNITKNQKFKI